MQLACQQCLECTYLRYAYHHTQCTCTCMCACGGWYTHCHLYVIKWIRFFFYFCFFCFLLLFTKYTNIPSLSFLLCLIIKKKIMYLHFKCLLLVFIPFNCLSRARVAENGSQNYAGFGFFFILWLGEVKNVINLLTKKYRVLRAYMSTWTQCE